MPDWTENRAGDGPRAHVLQATRNTSDDVVADFSSALRHLSLTNGATFRRYHREEIKKQAAENQSLVPVPWSIALSGAIWSDTDRVVIVRIVSCLD